LDNGGDIPIVFCMYLPPSLAHVNISLSNSYSLTFDDRSLCRALKELGRENGVDSAVK
jgi:hypothetical protein